MATITLEYDTHTKGVVDFLERIRESGFFTIKTPKRKKSGMEESIEDVEMGRVYQAQDVEDLFRQLEL